MRTIQEEGSFIVIELIDERIAQLDGREHPCGHLVERVQELLRDRHVFAHQRVAAARPRLAEGVPGFGFQRIEVLDLLLQVGKQRVAIGEVDRRGKVSCGLQRRQLGLADALDVSRDVRSDCPVRLEGAEGRRPVGAQIVLGLDCGAVSVSDRLYTTSGRKSLP